MLALRRQLGRLQCIDEIAVEIEHANARDVQLFHAVASSYGVQQFLGPEL